MLLTRPTFAATSSVSWLVAACLVLAEGAEAQVRLHPGASVTFTYPHVWRGLTRVNELSLHPEFYLGLEVTRVASVTGGVWAGLDLFRADSNEISDKGPGGRGLGEANVWAEVTRPLGAITLTGGVVSYRYYGEDPAASRTSDLNTTELYLRAQIDGALLVPAVAVYRDVGRLDSWYYEGSLVLSAPRIRFATTSIGLGVGVAAGLAAGQDLTPATPRNRALFAEDGWTHLEGSAAVQLDFAPVLAQANIGVPGLAFAAVHVQRNLDPETRWIRIDRRRDWKSWLAVGLHLGGPIRVQ